MLQYSRAQRQGKMDFSPAAVVDDFQRLAGKVVPYLSEFVEGDRVRLRQELAIVESVVDRMAGRAAVTRALRCNPLFPEAPMYPDSPATITRPGAWRLRARGPGSRKAEA